MPILRRALCIKIRILRCSRSQGKSKSVCVAMNMLQHALLIKPRQCANLRGVKELAFTPAPRVHLAYCWPPSSGWIDTTDVWRQMPDFGRHDKQCGKALKLPRYRHVPPHARNIKR